MNIYPLPYLEIPWISETALRTYTASTDLCFHRNSGYELVYVISGHYRWELESGRILDIRGNQVSLTRPETVHRGYIDHISPGTILYIVFDPASPDFGQACGLSSSEQAAIQSLLEAAGDEIHGTSHQFRAHIDMLIEQLKDLGDLGDLGELGDMGEQRAISGLRRTLLRHSMVQTLLLFFRDIEAGEAIRDDSPLSGLLSYIGDHIGDELGIDMLTRVSGWSSSRLYSLFRQYTGQSPNDYIQSVRCDRARELLSEGTEPITAIAFQLGFSSSQYFARVFSKYTGITPSAYRKRMSLGALRKGSSEKGGS
jgi:AraC-like DNA-binding protein